MLHVIFHPLARRLVQSCSHREWAGFYWCKWKYMKLLEAQAQRWLYGISIAFSHKTSWIGGEEKNRLHLFMRDAIKSHCERYREKRIVAIFCNLPHLNSIYTRALPLTTMLFIYLSYHISFITNWSKSEFSIYPIIMMDKIIVNKIFIFFLYKGFCSDPQSK